MLNDLCDGGVSRFASGIGNGAIGTEIIASVLHFNKTSCAVVARECSMEVLYFSYIADTERFLLCLLFFYFFDESGNVVFFILSEDKVDAFYL